MQQPQQQIDLRDIILDLAQLKRKEAELIRERDSVKNEILKKENFLYDTFQNESIQQARQARMEASKIKQTLPETSPTSIGKKPTK